jgi:hypothetical protein
VDLLAAWLLMPVVAIAACLGLGVLCERAAGTLLPGELVPAVGMATLVAAGQITTYWDWSAELTVPLIVVAAIAGLTVGWGRVRSVRPDGWAVIAAGGVFAVFAAPIVFSGDATFAGYTILGDTSIHLIGADALLEHGRSFESLPPSSYQAALEAYYGTASYPSGGPVATGALATLSLQDAAWVFQPFLSLLVAMTTLAVWSLLSRLVASRPLRSAIAFLASQPALVLAYALQGSVKEVGIVFAVMLSAALVPVYLRESGEAARRTIPLAVAAGAGVALVGAAAAVWLAPLLIMTLGAAIHRNGRRRTRPALMGAALLLVVAGAASWQAIAGVRAYVEAAGTAVTTQTEVGNLIGPLNDFQMLGIWLSGDYRLPPVSLATETYLLLGALLVAVGLGVAWVMRRRAWSLILLITVSVFAWAYVTRRGSPWADGKALMIISPVVVLVAGLGAAGMYASGRRFEGVALTIALAVGVLGSNALAYHDVSLAPRERLAELESIGSHLSGHGPTLYPEFEEFGKHFLREGAPTGPSEAWTPTGGPGPARSGGDVRFAFGVDLDALPLDYVQSFRTIVLRRGFMSSRPPAGWRRMAVGNHYEVWVRGDADVIEHIPLGEPRQPSVEPRCRVVRGLARRARALGVQLAAAPRTRSVLMVPAALPHPAAWVVDGTDPATLRPAGPGEVRGRVRVPTAGSYDLWAEGSFGRGIDVFLDGRRVGEARDALNGRLSAEHVARLELDAGSHEILIRRGGGNLKPGNGGGARLIGPLALTRSDPTGGPLHTVAPDDWRSLCGQPLDWIEAVRT